MRERMSISTILDAWQRMEMGQYELPWSLGLPGSRSGRKIACLQMAIVWLVEKKGV